MWIDIHLRRLIAVTSQRKLHYKLTKISTTIKPVHRTLKTKLGPSPHQKTKGLDTNSKLGLAKPIHAGPHDIKAKENFLRSFFSFSWSPAHNMWHSRLKRMPSAQEEVIATGRSPVQQTGPVAPIENLPPLCNVFQKFSKAILST